MINNAAPTTKEITTITRHLVDTAARIRTAIEKMDPELRRSKTKGKGRFANQYELDLIADEIVHDDFSDFGGYIVSEERELDKAQMESNALLLVVDPVDGSTNASRLLGYWCFSAALVYRGEVIAGVVVDQVTRRIFSATRDGGAKLIFADGSERNLDPASFTHHDVGTNVDHFSASVICFNSHEGPSIPFRHMRHFGASALAICDVAAGGFDAYIDDEDVLLKPWDILAAEFIACASGCSVIRRDSEGLMAATGVLVSRSEELITSFKKIFPHYFH